MTAGKARVSRALPARNGLGFQHFARMNHPERSVEFGYSDQQVFLHGEAGAQRETHLPTDSQWVSGRAWLLLSPHSERLHHTAWNKE